MLNGIHSAGQGMSPSAPPGFDKAAAAAGGCGPGCSCPGCSGAQAAGASGGAEGASEGGGMGAMQAQGAEIKQLLQQLVQLMEQLKQLLGGESSGGGSGASGPASSGGSAPSRREGNNIVNETGTGGQIPPPTQNVEQFQLGGKTVTIGTDGSASAQEVSQVKATLQQMYQNSPSFRQAIDSSQHQEMSVTLGRRGDNTSWGGGGNVFLNLNNIGPGDGDTFEELTAHEFGHAASGLDHGAELDAFQRRVAAET